MRRHRSKGARAISLLHHSDAPLLHFSNTPPPGALHAVLLLESPSAFRSRNLFISENALTRA